MSRDKDKNFDLQNLLLDTQYLVIYNAQIETHLKHKK